MKKSKIIFPEIMNLSFSDLCEVRIEAFNLIEDILCKIAPENLEEIFEMSTSDFLEQILPKMTEENESIEVKNIILKLISHIVFSSNDDEILKDLASDDFFMNELLVMLDSDNQIIEEASIKLLEILTPFILDKNY